MYDSTLYVRLGLMATGLWEKFMSTGMVVLLAVIVLASFLSGKADVSRAIYSDWTYAVPLLSSAIFCYIAQYAVPELARGMRHIPKKPTPKTCAISAIVRSQNITSHATFSMWKKYH